MVRARLGELAERFGARLSGNPDAVISGVGTLQNAGPGEISFLSNKKYRRYLEASKAGAVILSDEFAEACPGNALICDNPYLVYARIATHLFPQTVHASGVHPSAVIAASAKIDSSAHIGACVVIQSEVTVGKDAVIGPGCVIENNCEIGEASRLVANVTLCHGVRIGKRCLLHPGSVLGADGFGLANDQGRWEKVPQLGDVHLGDDVEVGANTCIDRGALEDTIIGDGVKLDNLIQIGHNVQIGADSALAAACAIAGSTKLGEGCTVGGLTGLAGHLQMGNNVHFSGAAQVSRSFSGPGHYSGNLPAMDTQEWRKTVVRIRQLEGMAKRLKELEKKIAATQADKN